MRADIRLFGSIEVRVGGRVLRARDFGGRKPKQLLEILVLQGGRPLSKSRLAELLWGEEEPANVAASLERYVSLVRKALDPGGGPTGSLVLTEHGGYRFDCSRARVDLLDFDATYRRQCAGPLDRPTLEDAVGLVTGELLEDEPDAEWALAARGVARQPHGRILIAAAGAALADGECARAAELAGEAAVLDPLAEEAVRLLMTARYRSGGQHEALLAYERFRCGLAEELGVDPLPETVALHQSILEQRPAVRLPAGRTGHGRTPLPPIPPAPSAAPSEPMHDEAGQPAFLGRQPELSAVLDACTTRRTPAGSPAPLVLVHGEPGIGKSRLLDEVVDRLGDRDVVRLRCRELERDLPGSLVGDVLGALGAAEVADRVVSALDDGPESAARRRLVELLRATLQARRPVLVIDDAHWADPFSTAILTAAVRRCSGGVVLLAAQLASLPGDHPLRQVEPALDVPLATLSAGDLAHLGVPGLYERTGGLPLLVVASMAAAVPDGTGQPAGGVGDNPVIARLRRLGEHVLRLLLVASVVSTPFGPEEVSQLLGGDLLVVAEDLERLVQLQVLALVGGGFVFRYEQVREALGLSLSPARRRVLTDHLAAAQGTADPHPSVAR